MIFECSVTQGIKLWNANQPEYYIHQSLNTVKKYHLYLSFSCIHFSGLNYVKGAI